MLLVLLLLLVDEVVSKTTELWRGSSPLEAYALHAVSQRACHVATWSGQATEFQNGRRDRVMAATRSCLPNDSNGDVR